MRVGLFLASPFCSRETAYFSRLRPSRPHQRTAEVIAVTNWLSGCLRSGSRVLVAAIVYYELKRELLRAKKTFSIGRLDAFINVNSGRYVPLSDEALRLAADLWAKSRQAGKLTADSKALDIDVILAAQA